MSIDTFLEYADVVDSSFRVRTRRQDDQQHVKTKHKLQIQDVNAMNEMLI